MSSRYLDGSQSVSKSRLLRSSDRCIAVSLKAVRETMANQLPWEKRRENCATRSECSLTLALPDPLL